MDPFAALGIEPRFDVDLASVERRHRELSRALHPDRWAKEGKNERRVALEKALSVNEAWRVVKDPVTRAEALFRIAGIPVGEQNEPAADPAFLMDVLENREELTSARTAKDAARVLRLTEGVRARARETEKALELGFSSGGDLHRLVRKLGELRFYRRFLEEARIAEEELAS